MFNETRDIQKGVVNIVEGINNFASGLLVFGVMVQSTMLHSQ